MATHTISPNLTFTQDDVRWYVFDVSSGTPALSPLQQGDVVNPATGAGTPGFYDFYPSIDINSAGSIGLTYIQSANLPGNFVSMWVTGRTVNDAPGSMQEVPSGVWAQGLYQGERI